MATPPERASRHVRSGRVNRRPPSFVATLIALAIVFALAWMFFVRSGSSVPTPETSAVQGAYTWQPGDGGGAQNGTFGAVAGGDAGGKAAAPEGQTAAGSQPPQSAYDAGTRTETTLGGSGSGFAERSIGAWPPVWRVATRSPLDYQGLSAIVRAAVEDGDAAVGIKPLEQGARTVWRAAMRMDGKVIEVVVDQKTGIVTWFSDGTATFTADVDWASPPAAGTKYSVAVPAGTPVKTTRAGGYTYAASPAAAGKAAGFDPLVSDLAPDGFSLKAVATSDATSEPSAWLGGPASSIPHPPGHGPLEVDQLSTRGLSWFEMRQLGAAGTKEWRPYLQRTLASVRGDLLSFQETTLQYGAFKGETASTWYQPSGPSLLVIGARRTVFVTGALTRQELIAYAEGLKPVPAAK